MEPMIGQIIQVGFNFVPRGFAFCDGQLLPINTNQSLFSLLGTIYGGDGRTTFALPDLRGRAALHPGDGPGLSSVRLGEKSGREFVTLTTQNLPPHNHTANLHAETALGTSSNPQGRMLALGGDSYADPIPADDRVLAPQSITVQNTGGGQDFSIRNPFLGINHCIALVGLYPSRN